MKTIISIFALLMSISPAIANLEETVDDVLTQREKDVAMRLPKPLEIEDPRQQFTVEPLADGKFKFNKQVLDQKDLKLAIQNLQKAMGEKPLSATIKADPSIKHALMINLFELLAEAGISDVNLKLDPPNDAKGK